MPKPFHKRNLKAWHRALQSEDESKSLVLELIDNCGVEILENDFVWRSRLNLSPNSISTSAFDSPPIETQKRTFNRFQPTKTNCLYVTSSEETAILEKLPSIADLEDIIYVAHLKVSKPMRMVNLINNIRFPGGTDVPEWTYKPVLGPLFLNEDPNGITEVLKVSQILSQKIFEHGLDGIIYPSRSAYMANLDRRIISVQNNYIIFGNPIREEKLSFDPSSIKKYCLKSKDT